MTIFVNLKDIIGVTIFALIAIVVIALLLRQAWRQHRCKHLRYTETSACDAICRECGKNLGFIGNVRGDVK